MCMRNRLSKCSKHLAFATCLFALGGSFSACQDEYFLDDEKPKWLNSSIYETLESNGNYQNYLRLIADPDVNSGSDENSSLVEILKRTGSKTVFVANDQAWDKFFKANEELPEANPWKKATSYENLTKSQKKLLLHTSMLNNAIVMENLSSSAGSKPTRGEYLRRSSDVEVFDSVNVLSVNDLPRTRWSIEKQLQDNPEYYEIDQWGRIRNGGDLGYEKIYIMSKKEPLMIHFTNEYLTRNKITPEDFRIIMGRERITDDVHVYSSLLDSTDIVCENGYVNMAEKPLVPTANMAEIIQTNGKTKIFSHMMERFSTILPLASSVSKTYSLLNPNFNETDTLYYKLYYSKRSEQSTSSSDISITMDDKGNLFANGNASLTYDPSDNWYHPISTGESKDMGAMFIPNDDQMVNYFNNGGKDLIMEFTKNPTFNYTCDSDEELERLFEDIDQIPLSITQSIINHAMQTSFVNSVPSKMLSLSEAETLEQIFSDEDTRLRKEGGNIDRVIVGCNGAVYIMNNLFTPSDFNCVATPAFIRAKNSLMQWAIYNDKNREASQGEGMGLNYYAYLKAMKSKFTFLLPTDDALQYNYDPMSFSSASPRVMRIVKPIRGGDENYPFDFSKASVCKTYNVETGEIGGNAKGVVTKEAILNRLRIMLENFTIVHENGQNTINTDEDEYYLSKNGMGIKVTRGEVMIEGKPEPRVIKVQGGFQLENEKENISNPANNPGITFCDVDIKESSEYKNGWTFTLNAPPIPASRSVFSVMSGIKRGDSGKDDSKFNTTDNPYYEFFKLCYNADYDIIKNCIPDEKYEDLSSSDKEEVDREINNYLTFTEKKAVDYNVTFFNNYRYTVFAPNNEAVLDAISKGLPTWESIKQEYDNAPKDEDGRVTSEEDRLKIKAKIIYLTNFIRSHFTDNTVFADKSEMNQDMVTSCYDDVLGVFVKINVTRIKEGGSTTLKVKDLTESSKYHSASKEDAYANIMTCDRYCSADVSGKLMTNQEEVARSYAVVHLIDGVLNHTELKNGKYNDFSDEKEAREYINRFAIR